MGNGRDLIKTQNKTLSDVIACREDMYGYLEKQGVDKALSFKIAEDVRKGKKIKPEYYEKIKNLVPE
jgi:DNA polymerase-3 subunit alpha (Gram-positive type)